MLHFARTTLTGVFVLSIASSAYANWKHTDWGMTLEQIGVDGHLKVQVVADGAQRKDPVLGEVLAEAPYELLAHPGHEGMFEFLFENDHLVGVRDTFPNFDPDKTLKSLIEAYGIPVAVIDGSGRRDWCWIDWNNRNKVWYTLFHGPSLAYETILYTSALNPAGCDFTTNH